MVIKRQFNSLFFLFLYLNVILLIIKNILMKKIYFLCFLCLFGVMTTMAQLSGNKGFKLNINSYDAYLDCGYIATLNNTGAYTVEMWVNINLDELEDRFIIFKK